MCRLPALFLSVLVGVAGASIPLQPAHGAVLGFTVNSTGDAPDSNVGNGKCATASGQCTLRAAIQESNALGNAANTINLPAGTITLTVAGSSEDSSATGDLDIKVNMKLLGSASGTTIKAGASFDDRIFDVPSGKAPNVELHLMTIQGGKAPGTQGGGGLRYRGTGSLLVIDTTFTGNSTGGPGGGLYQSSGTLNLNLTNFTNNTAGTRGGGAALEKSATTTQFSHLTFTGNTAFEGGGLAAFVVTGATGSIPKMDMSTFTGNQTTAGGYGGGMAVARTSMVWTTISGNTASYGGGMEIVGSTQPVGVAGRNTISGNTATVNGGGIYTKNCGSSCGSLLHVTVEDNTATKEGSGIYVNDGLSVEKTTIDANSTGGQGAYGGTVYHAGSAGKLVITNSTIGENTGGPVSGGVVDAATTTDVFTNVTIGNNSGGTANGVALTPSATAPQLKNTVVSSSGTNCNRSLASLGHNLDSGNSCGFNQSGDKVNIDPLLEPLADNGGGTHTMRIGKQSPALDSGDNNGCPIYDQRSGRRPWDGNGSGGDVCDIGAFELGPSSANVDVGFSSVTATVSAGKVTYVLNLKNTGAFDSTDSILTDTLPGTLSFVSCTATLGGVCSGTGNSRKVTYGTIALGSTPKVTIVATILGTGTITDSMVVWSENTDWFPVDNTASATIQV